MASERKTGTMAGKQGLIAIFQDYINRMTEVSGMKALILDSDTIGMISMVFSQSEILEKEVFLVQKIDTITNATDELNHLKAIVFIRPTYDSIQILCQHLQKPKFAEYHIFFSNILRADSLRQIAEADTLEVVRQVQEFYLDAYAVTSELFSLNIPSMRSLYDHHWGLSHERAFDRISDGLIGVLLAMKRRPVIRYQNSSHLCRRLALELDKRIKEENLLFDFRQRLGSDPLLLIVDRREDPVTPLLLQWTYQAMVHELLTISNNRVDLRTLHDPKVKEVVLSADQDSFYKNVMFLNFGDLGTSIKNLVEDYASKTQSTADISSIADMQRFVENYPDFISMSGSVSKHVTLMSELSSQVESRQLLQVSEAEQDLACTENHSNHIEMVLRLMNNIHITYNDKIRIVLLYALRYETRSRNELHTLRSLLRDQAPNHVERSRIRIVDALLEYAGSRKRGGDLFGNNTFLSQALSKISSGIIGVENIYTQHKPLLVETLELLFKNKLRINDFPIVDGVTPKKPQEVIVFMVGGTTYDEACQIASLNLTTFGNITPSILLGGTHIHNSESFLNDILHESNDQGGYNDTNFDIKINT